MTEAPTHDDLLLAFVRGDEADLCDLDPAIPLPLALITVWCQAPMGNCPSDVMTNTPQ